MTTLLAFLACIVLLPFVIAVLSHIILPALWKLKYVILAVVLPIIAWLIWAGCYNVMLDRQRQQTPIVYEDSVKKWIREHPEIGGNANR